MNRQGGFVNAEYATQISAQATRIKAINSYKKSKELTISNGEIITCSNDGFLIAKVISNWDQIGLIEINTSLGWIEMCGERAGGNDGSCMTSIELYVASGFQFRISWSAGEGKAYLFFD